MGLFGQTSPFDADIDKATSEKNTTEPWGVIMDICDKVSSNPRNVKDCLKSIMRRLAHNDPHVVIQAVTLLDACVSNCGKSFHLEVASRDFENEYKRLLSKAQPQVASKMRLSLKRWAENEFKSDPQLNLIPTLYQKLKSEGHDFSDAQKTQKITTPVAALKDPNVVTSQQEEEDIAKAIELSLKEAKGSPKKQTATATATVTTTSGSAYPSLYPSFSTTSTMGAAALSTTTAQPEPRKVRALYDFEAAEENEMTFTSGEIIHVIDDTDPNWWKGYNQRGEGLFPSNFVTADLSVEPEKLDTSFKSKKSVQFDDDAKKDEKTETKLHDDIQYVPEINEEKIDRLLHLLHEANPEDPSQDSDEMLRLEDEVTKMGPLIDAELERVDRKHAQLTQLSSDLVDAINLYHTLMREDRNSIPHGPPLGASMSYMPNYSLHQNMYGHNPMFGIPGNMYQGVPNSMAPTSMPSIQMMPIMPGAQPTSQQIGQPPQQISMGGNPQANAFSPHPQQIPIQFQNGHAPLSIGQQQAHQQPPQQQQQQQQQQPPQQQQVQLQNVPQPQSQPVTSHQLQMQQQQSQHQMHQQHIPNSSQANQNFLPQTFAPQPTNYPTNISSLPPGSYHHIHQPHPQMIHNGPMGNMLGQPPPMGVNNNMSLPLQQQMAAINQPVTQTILGQNDSKTNIPVYQQQR